MVEMATTEEKQNTEQAPAKKSPRGGSRPGAGRKPIEGSAFTRYIIIRVTDEQKDIFIRRGGSRWIRSVIAQTQNNIRTLRKDPGAMSAHQIVSDFNGRARGIGEKGEPEAIDFNKLLVRNPESTFALRINGDFMDEAGLQKGDMVVVDNSRPSRTGDIVVMKLGDEYIVRRLLMDLKYKSPYLKAESSSGQYEDIYPSEDQNWQYIGVVVHCIKSFKR